MTKNAVRNRWRLLVEWIPPGGEVPVKEEVCYPSYLRAKKAYARRLRELWTSKHDGKSLVKDFRIGLCGIRKAEWQSPAIYYAEGSFTEACMAGVVVQIKEKVAGLRALIS